MINGHFGREGWKTVRAAMANWGATARFVVIILAIAVPALFLALMLHPL